MSTTVTSAVVGGRGVGAAHVAALRAIGAQVHWIVGSDPVATRAIATRLDIARWTTNYHDVLGTDVDVVHVCTPNNTHFQIVKDAILAGKHVVCEKPLTIVAGQADELTALATAASVRTTVCYNYRFLPLVRRLRLMIRGGELGGIHSVRAEYLQNWQLGASSGWRSDPLIGGRSRVLGDIGTHLIDLVEIATGRSLVAEYTQFNSLTAPAQSGRDDEATVVGRLGSTAQAALHVSQVSASHTNTLKLAIDGGRGAVEWSFDGVERLRFVASHGSAQVAVDDHIGASVAGQFWTQHIADGLAIRQLFTRFYGSITESSSAGAGAMPLPTFEEGARHVALVDRASASMLSPTHPANTPTAPAPAR